MPPHRPPVVDYVHSDGVTLPFPEENRCAARSKNPSADGTLPPGRRCRRRVSTGLRVCAKHGGATNAAVDKRERYKAMAAMQRFVTPIPGSDLEANPIAAFEMEFRRTIAKIRVLDEILGALDTKDLGWGTSEKKYIGSGEFPGTDETERAQMNIYYVMQREERKHLVDLIKIWIGAKLDIRKLEIEEQKVDALNGVIERILSALGHDIHAPDTRRLVRNEILSLPVAGRDSANVIATAKQIVANGHSLVQEAVKTANTPTPTIPPAKG